MDRKKQLRRGLAQRGMTLIEIMVVVAILGMIASVVGVAVMGRFQEAKIQTAQLDIKGFGNGLNLYKLKHSRYPTTAEGLAALYSEGFLEGAQKKDPWGNDYVYICPGTKNPNTYDIMSYGADDKPGGDGEDADITN
ncbi:MAG TPA: type II secretion system major pseudopilin GspG [Myxococcales bacterium]|nr:type II secretion system major pseudopilin GspG [Myxococcales bacterium]